MLVDMTTLPHCAVAVRLTPLVRYSSAPVARWKMRRSPIDSPCNYSICPRRLCLADSPLGYQGCGIGFATQKAAATLIGTTRSGLVSASCPCHKHNFCEASGRAWLSRAGPCGSYPLFRPSQLQSREWRETKHGGAPERRLGTGTKLWRGAGVSK